MIVLCAWCEQAGRRTLLRETEPRGQSLTSHGICEAHEKVMLMEVDKLRKRDEIRHIPRRLSLPNARGDRSPITVRYLHG